VQAAVTLVTPGKDTVVNALQLRNASFTESVVSPAKPLMYSNGEALKLALNVVAPQFVTSRRFSLLAAIVSIAVRNAAVMFAAVS
jgi:type IV secretory pathway ATPase VirB11/archaellum biosynthesis ATPase